MHNKDIFEYIGGVRKELLADNMGSIVDTKTPTVYKEFITFTNDMRTNQKNVSQDILILKENMNLLTDLWAG